MTNGWLKLTRVARWCSRGSSSGVSGGAVRRQRDPCRYIQQQPDIGQAEIAASFCISECLTLQGLDPSLHQHPPFHTLTEILGGLEGSSYSPQQHWRCSIVCEMNQMTRKLLVFVSERPNRFTRAACKVWGCLLLQDSEEQRVFYIVRSSIFFLFQLAIRLRVLGSLRVDVMVDDALDFLFPKSEQAVVRLTVGLVCSRPHLLPPAFLVPSMRFPKANPQQTCPSRFSLSSVKVSCFSSCSSASSSGSIKTETTGL